MRSTVNLRARSALLRGRDSHVTTASLLHTYHGDRGTRRWSCPAATRIPPPGASGCRFRGTLNLVDRITEDGDGEVGAGRFPALAASVCEASNPQAHSPSGTPSLHDDTTNVTVRLIACVRQGPPYARLEADRFKSRRPNELGGKFPVSSVRSDEHAGTEGCAH